VKAAAAAFYAALNARNIGAMEALWARDANPIMIHPSGPHARAPVAGWEAAREGLREAADHAKALARRLNSLFKVDAFKVHEMTAGPVVPPPDNLRPVKQRRDKLSGRKL
jgi:hypothetical protein